MYGPVEGLPPAYEGFRIATYRDRVQVKGSFNKRAVITAETDTDTILNHALIQAAPKDPDEHYCNRPAQPQPASS
jgi:hypothetical protein